MLPPPGIAGFAVIGKSERAENRNQAAWVETPGGGF
jgi:hypothetical protein